MDVYMYQAALWCETCGEKVKARLNQEGKQPQNTEDETTWDSDEYPKGPYPDGGGEADSPQHCDGCGLFLENPLTSDGLEYVRGIVNAPKAPGLITTDPNNVAAEWAEFYGIEEATGI